ncbi:MAG: PD-(D/E)XK nuclease family protein, partial [Actinomycetota bacterium]|nr:PD-(D/E)XK nuclease family protein [Actinomycetota bacterium]
DSPSQGSANIGTLVHDIAHELGDDVDEPTLVAEVERRWGRLGLPPGWMTDRQLEEARKMVRRLAAYYQQAQATQWSKVGSELPVRVDVGRATIVGRVDRLERDSDGRLRVLDYKTGSATVSKAKLGQHPQLATYQVATEHGAFRDEGSTSAGAALLQLGKAALKTVAPQVQPPLAESDDPGWAERLVTDTAEGMGGAEFVAVVGDWCTFCPVRSSCPAQAEGDTI